MKMRKVLALSLSAAMTMGMALPVMAADPPAVTAPIYSFETINVVVPTTYKVAFNPEGLTVKVGSGASDTSTAQILSKNYGILNKSNKDMLCTVALKVEDKNTGDNKVTFVDSAADATTNAKDGEYKIYLSAVPADATEVKVGNTPTAADKDTAAAALDEVSMTGATTQAVALKAGDNKLAFKLDKAEYEPTGSGVELGSTNTNNVASSYQIKAVATGGKGITAFTFSGSMNTNADWTKLTNGIEITPVYTSKVAASTDTVISGTGAMVKVGPQVSVSSTGLITMTGFTSTKNFKVATLTNGNGTFGINESPVTWNSTQWSEANGGTLTAQLGDEWMNSLKGGTVTVTVTLTDNTTISETISIPA